MVNGQSFLVIDGYLLNLFQFGWAKINEFCCCPGLHAGLKLKTLRLSHSSTTDLLLFLKSLERPIRHAFPIFIFLFELLESENQELIFYSYFAGDFWFVMIKLVWFLGVNLLSREGNSQRGHRRSQSRSAYHLMVPFFFHLIFLL